VQLGPAEILVVLVIALLVFGPNKLPEVGRQVGRAYREVRRFQRSISSEMSDVFADDLSDGAAPAPSLPAITDAPEDNPPDDDAPDDDAPDDGETPARAGTGTPNEAPSDEGDAPGDVALGDEKAER